jgi:hypothetical protein
VYSVEWSRRGAPGDEHATTTTRPSIAGARDPPVSTGQDGSRGRPYRSAATLRAGAPNRPIGIRLRRRDGSMIRRPARTSRVTEPRARATPCPDYPRRSERHIGRGVLPADGVVVVGPGGKARAVRHDGAAASTRCAGSTDMPVIREASRPARYRALKCRPSPWSGVRPAARLLPGHLLHRASPTDRRGSLKPWRGRCVRPRSSSN